jgi:hypothetical protein
MALPLDPSAPPDFDCFIGSWKVTHRRLRVRLAGCTEWETFSGVCVAQKILGGFGNVDDNVLETPSGTYRALSIRSFDAEAGTWSIWWLDGRKPGMLDVPVVGHFANGVGTFFTEDTWEGRPIRVRFSWTRPRPESPHWEQAFSPDGGATWETNWVMDFTRS